jgi:hypothetical protein
MKKYYNNDRKIEYLTTQHSDAKDSNVKNIASVFNMAAKFEAINNKDLCEFTFDELLAMFNLNQWGNFATFKTKKTIITNYIKYCISNNLCYNDNLRDILRLNHTDIKKKSKFEIEYYKDFDDFHNTIQTLFNDGGQQYEVNLSNIGILYLLWFGFEKEEIIEIRNDDFDSVKRTITCRSTNRTVHIDNDEVLTMFMHLKKAISSPRWNSKRNRWYYLDYKNPDYLIKSERADVLASVNLRVRVSSLNNYIKENQNMEKKYANKKITDYGISSSGLYNKIKSIEEDRNIKFMQLNIYLFNELLNTNIPTELSGGAYDFIKNYDEWKNFFYGE